jgi:hypothetical protein
MYLANHKIDSRLGES